ncbi:hypothetical protein V6574_19080 [Streptomyces sp. SM1P]
MPTHQYGEGVLVAFGRALRHQGVVGPSALDVGRVARRGIPRHSLAPPHAVRARWSSGRGGLARSDTGAGAL